MGQGIHIEMGHRPQVILDTMDRINRGGSHTKGDRRLGCVATLALAVTGLLAYFLDVILGYGRLFAVAAYVLWAMALVFVVVIMRLPRRRFPRKQFEVVRQILHTLRDDTGRKGRVVGWLDLTGQQKKSIRTAYSTSGRRKEYYRDPWFQVKIKLVDGNLLRLSLVDRIKTKTGRATQHSTRFTAKLVVNPGLYRVDSIPSNGLPPGHSALAYDDGIFTITADFGPNLLPDLPVEQVLETLKAVYSRLNPIEQDLQLGPGEPGKEA